MTSALSSEWTLACWRTRTLSRTQTGIKRVCWSGRRRSRWVRRCVHFWAVGRCGRGSCTSSESWRGVEDASRSDHASRWACNVCGALPLSRPPPSAAHHVSPTHADSSTDTDTGQHQALSTELDEVQPNLKAAALFDEVVQRSKASMEDYNAAKEELQKLTTSFQAVRAKRRKAFMKVKGGRSAFVWCHRC
jgi:hypothetical protein